VFVTLYVLCAIVELLPKEIE